jgi:cyclic pyranopterin phosphate synthase
MVRRFKVAVKSKQLTCSGMVDISDKVVTKRRAVAIGAVTFDSKAFKLFVKEGSPKGNIFETAKIAGIMAAKSTPSIIPLCHPLALDKVNVNLEIVKSERVVVVTAEVVSTGKTGVEMEALAAVCAACLTVYDMMKWSGQTMTIADVRLVHKSGGKSGTFDRKV